MELIPLLINKTNPKTSLSTGSLVGIILGALIFLVMVFLLWFFFLRKKKIIYHLDEGDNDPMNPDVVEHNSQEILLSSPNKDGYFFRGWFLDETFQVPIKAIPANLNKKLVLYAKWEKIP